MKDKELTFHNIRLAIKPDGTPVLQRRTSEHVYGKGHVRKWEDLPVVFLEDEDKNEDQ